MALPTIRGVYMRFTCMSWPSPPPPCVAWRNPFSGPVRRAVAESMTFSVTRTRPIVIGPSGEKYGMGPLWWCQRCNGRAAAQWDEALGAAVLTSRGMSGSISLRSRSQNERSGLSMLPASITALSTRLAACQHVIPALMT